MLVVRRRRLVSGRACPSTAGSRPAGCARACSRCPADGLPTALDGLRIGHLSDFHLGAPLSRGNRASERGCAGSPQRRPDLVCITGDLVSHPRGEPSSGASRRPRRAVRRARQPRRRRHARPVLAGRRASRPRAGDGCSETRSRPSRCAESAVSSSASTRRATGRDSRARTSSAAQGSGFRLLLCHFPGIVDRLPGRSFDLILAGHLHAGQICLPLPASTVTLAHPRARYVSGLYQTPAGTMHVSPGTGTTFVPFRFFARPEVTELVLRTAGLD